MNNAWRDVLAYAQRQGLTLRTAATCLAVERVASAHDMRGLYP